MAQTASPLYIFLWAFFPAAIDVEAYMSNVYADMSSAQHYAETIRDFLRNKDTEGIYTDNAFPCTAITESQTRENFNTSSTRTVLQPARSRGAYESTDQSAYVSSQLVISHDENDMPH